MTESNQGSGEQSQEQPSQQFVLQKVYLKDVSFETPNSPEIFTEKWEPTVNIELKTNGKALAAEVHEVVLGITVTAKVGEKVAYLVEVHQAGVFGVSGFSESDMGPLLGSYCPNLLFPFAREAISDLVTKGGFPQLLLQPVNFDAIYQDHIRQANQEPVQENPVH
ncbi:MAG: protein-export chaperone SecB [Gammaproteobacteria bacterium]|nr:protein-export chaperone SecB [Gammaproteobacteria bacterium]MDH5800267.1 protein-export chaperone SecB [Gammaproteobacteria bacterium]